MGEFTMTRTRQERMDALRATAEEKINEIKNNKSKGDNTMKTKVSNQIKTNLGADNMKKQMMKMAQKAHAAAPATNGKVEREVAAVHEEVKYNEEDIMVNKIMINTLAAELGVELPEEKYVRQFVQDTIAHASHVKEEEKPKKKMSFMEKMKAKADEFKEGFEEGKEKALREHRAKSNGLQSNAAEWFDKDVKDITAEERQEYKRAYVDAQISELFVEKEEVVQETTEDYEEVVQETTEDYDAHYVEVEREEEVASEDDDMAILNSFEKDPLAFQKPLA